jgi:hypothetical protein
MMVRGLYRSLVWLHPVAFRLQFGEEMLWIFDQAVDTWSAGSLIADAGISLARQWAHTVRPLDMGSGGHRGHCAADSFIRKFLTVGQAYVPLTRRSALGLITDFAERKNPS